MSKSLRFLGPEAGAPQPPQEVTIPCPNRAGASLQKDKSDKTLQAVRFADKKVPVLNLDIDEDFQASQCFTELI